jgi:hypothetical protein
MVTDSGEGDDVQCPVELAIAEVEAVVALFPA